MTDGLEQRLRVSLLAFALVALGAGCSCGSTTTPTDSGVPDASVDMDAGVDDAGTEVPDAGVEDAGPPPMLALRRLLPPRGSSAGGSSVLLEGSAFLRDFAGTGSQAKPLTSIKVGSNPVLDFQIIDDETIELRTPPGVAGPASVSLTNPNGAVICNNCFTYFDELVVTSFAPRQGPLEGGTEVTLNGQGFTQDTQVLFGSFSSPRITFVSSTQLKAVAPRGAVADLVDVVVYNKNGVNTQRRSYQYVASPRLVAVLPPTGPLSGGTVVTLVGTGFSGVTGVKFGAFDGTALAVNSDSLVTVTTPPGASAGAVDVTLVTPVESRTFKGAFAYADPTGPFAVFGVFPHVIVPGQVVTVLGQALDSAPLTVTIGGEVATVGMVTPTTARVTVPPRAAAPRKSDVVLAGPGSATLTAALTWKIGLTSIAPTSGPAAGGTAVTVVASALPADAQVRIGTFPATGVTVTGETGLTATTAAGSGGGASDVVVREAADAENEAVLAGAFTYLEPLSIGRVQPERGAIAGNTLVTVLGAGFGDATVVSFGQAKAKDLKVIDSHTLTCRTPKANQVGVVDVRVDRLTENDTLPGGFSYFDPRSISGGMSGGPLVGTLNITVLDSTQGNFGAPVPGATVMLGLDPTTPYQGDTDQRGQITFSDPSLVKAQVVTVFKANYESTTVTSVNSENLTVFISRTGGGDGNPGPPPPSPPPSTIAGRVTGFKSPRPLVGMESLEARVFVAQTSLYGGPPFAGLPNKSREKWRITADGGEYLVFTGAGLRAVYAVLGIANAATQSFQPVAMGVKRSITTSPDNPATGQDIVLDMQLDLTVPITIDSPLTFQGPLGPEPGMNSVYAWLDLGAEGFIPNPNNWGTGLAPRSSVSSAGSSLSFPSFPQLDGSNFIFLNEAAGSSSYPVSYYFRRQPGDMHLGVTIGPLLPAPNLTAPIGGTFTGTISWTMAPGVVPDIHNVQILKPTLFGNLTLWNMVLPGTETQVVLPQPAVEKLLREEAGNPLFVVIYSSRSPKFAYTQWTYDTLSGVSWSSFTIALSDAFTP
jgi:hypothetical protein